MIAKTTLGSDFEGALTYGAGQRQGRRQELAELLLAVNVREGTPQRMAQEMQRLAAESSRIRKPVWHTALSWPPGEQVSREQKIAAAEKYCELMGAPFENHQVVVFEHHDKPHEHIHIYLNRVPLDGGPALRTDNNFYKQPGVCRQISQELGMQALPQRRRSVNDVDPGKQRARELVRRTIAEALRQAQGKNLAWFTEQLQLRNINVRYTHDKQGILRGVSFEVDRVGVTGQEVGYKGAQLRAEFAQAQSPPPQLVSPALPLIPPQPKPRPEPKKRGLHL